jgi:hypothetical protein
MMEVLEHIPNPVQALKDIHRVANSVVVTVPNAYWYRRFLRWTVKKTVTVFHEHLYNWTLPELTNLLQYAGFKVAYYGFTNLVQWHKPSMLSPILSHVTMQILVVKAVRHHVSMVQG